MQIQYVPILQIEKNGRHYTLLIPNQAPFADCIEVCSEMAERFKEIEAEEIKRREEAKSLEKPEEVAVEIVDKN